MIKRSSRAIVASTKPIFKAIEQDDLDAIKRFIEENKKLLNEPNEEGKSPLHFACALGRTSIVNYLLGAGAQVNFLNKFDKRGSFRRVPLHDAAKGGHASVIECLAKRNAELNIKDGQGDTALHLAAGFIQAPPEDGSDIETLRQTNEPHFLAVVIALCEQGADLDLTNERSDSQIVGRTALHLAIVRGHKLIALELIKRKAKIDTKDCDGHSPYLSAYRRGMREVCEALIQRLKDEDQQEAPMKSYFNRLGLDFVDEDHNTLLHTAARDGDEGLVSLLCLLGADPNPLDKENKTPLFLAASGGYANSVKALLGVDANPRIKISYSEKTALDKARKKGHHECVALIEAWLEEHPLKETAPPEAADEWEEIGLQLKETAPPAAAHEREEIGVQPTPTLVSLTTEVGEELDPSLASTHSLLTQFIKENSAQNASVNRDYCLQEMLQSQEGTSRFRQSLHGDGDFIEWLLGLKHFPKKIPILYEVMADLHAEISTHQAMLPSAAVNKGRFFPAAQVASKAHDLRKRLLHRIFHQFDWPDELIEAIALLIGGSASKLNPDPTREKSKEHQLLDLLLSHCASPNQLSSLQNHALIILMLAYQSLENNPEKGKFPGRLKLEAQFYDQFQKCSEEMLTRTKALYDYLCKISADLASAFLKKIVKSESLLRFALQKALSGEGWWNVELSEQFEETLFIQFNKSGPSADY